MNSTEYSSLLKKYGWNYVGNCGTCSIVKHQFLHPGKPTLLIKVMPAYKSFEVFDRGNLDTSAGISLLEEKLKTL